MALLLTGYIFRGAGAADAATNAGTPTCGADIAFPNLLNASVLYVGEILVKIAQHSWEACSR